MTNIKKNFIYSVGYQILNIILPIITAPYLSRIVGATNLGIYSFTHSVASYFVLIAMLGLNNYGNRAIAAIRDNRLKTSKTFWEIYCVQVVSTIIIIISYGVYLNYFAINTTISTIWFLFVLSALFDINWFYFGIEQFKLTVTRNIIIKIISVILIFILVKTKEDLWKYTLIMSVGTLTSQLILWFYLRRYINLVKISLSEIIKHIKPLFILFIPVIAVSIYTIMDKIMIGLLSTMTENGYYENAQKIMIFPTGIITALGVVMLPQISNLVSKGEVSKIKNYISNSMMFTTITSIAIAFGLAGIAPVFAPVFFGTEFIPSGNVMTILSITVVVIAWANVIRTQYLIPHFKDKVYVISVIIGAFINLMFNVFLIPGYGAVGAAIGTVFAEISVAIYQTWAVRKELDISLYIRNGIPFILIGTVMFLIIKVIGTLMGISVITVIVEILVGATIYIILSLIYLIKTKNPIAKNFISKLIKSKQTI
jgi:O-antigen/teichoic acid export membrane protein